MELSAPAPLSERHVLDHFDSGAPSLDEWLRRRARANQATGASRTFVVCAGDEVAAFFSLASGSINLIDATGGLRRNMPDPIPVVILARLAVDRRLQGRGLGKALLADAAKRVLAAGESIGIRGLVVHALNAQAAAFYAGLGFEAAPGQPLTLMIPLSRLRASL